MKKIFTFLLAAVMILSLAACGAKEQSVTLTVEDSGIISVFVLEATGDTVHTIKQTTSMECTGFTEDQFAIINESVEQYKEIYAQIEGVEYDVEITDEKMNENITIDVSNKETLSILADQGLLPLDNVDAETISLKKTVENMTEQGWVVQK